jgi:hypothetical protein
MASTRREHLELWQERHTGADLYLKHENERTITSLGE